MKLLLKLLFTLLCFLFLTAQAESTLPSALRIIDAETFCGASNIGEVLLPEGAAEIRSRAFADSGLTSINLPSSLTYIADDAFSGCESVEIFVDANSAAWNWCHERGMVGPEWTLFEQIRSDSVAIQWTAPESANLTCDILLCIDDEWTTIAAGLTEPEYNLDALIPDETYTIALHFSGTETISDGNTTYTFVYSYRTDEQTIDLQTCRYSWWIDDGECIITGAETVSDTERIELAIPSELGGCPVTRIGKKAFTAMSTLTKVTIPNTVQHIDSTAFYGCKNLQCVEMTDSVLTIGDYAFAECSSLNTIRLSDSIISIGEYTFCNNAALTEIQLPAALVDLGKKALYGTDIRRIALPDALETIDAQAWGDSVTEIIAGEQSAFVVENGILYSADMTRLIWIPRSMHLINYIAPETVTSVAVHVFENRTDLISADFPGGLTEIGESAFSGCTQLQNLSGLETLVSIGDRAFSGCSALTDSAFQNLTQLQSAGAYAFSGCASLENVPLPDSLTYLGEAAFENCTALLSATLGSRMSSIGNAAFYGCTALQNVQLPASLSEPDGFGSYMFYNCSKLLAVTVPAGVTDLNDRTFYGCTELQTLTLPQSLTTIGTAVCFKCSALTSLTFPDSVTTIGSYAFTYCGSLTSIDLPACSVKKYGFAECDSLESVRFAESKSRTISLGENAFYSCNALQAAYLPINVNAIDASAFKSSPNVKLYVAENSAAHTFAVENALPYEIAYP